MNIMGTEKVRVFNADTLTENSFEFHWIRSNGDGEIYGFITYPHDGGVLPGTSGFYRTEDLETARIVACTLARRFVNRVESEAGYPAKIVRPVPA